MTTDLSPTPRETRRLESLRSHDILDTPAEEAFDSLTRLGSRLTGAPVCLISLVDAHRQYFKSAHGLPPELSNTRETPLSHSYCKHVVAEETVFQVDNSQEDSRVKDNGATTELNVSAYLGAPLIDDAGNVLGAACAIDFEPRQWSAEDAEILSDIAKVASSAISRSGVNQRAIKVASELADENALLRKQIETLAHDLKNPLSSILFSSSLLKEQIPEEGPLTRPIDLISASSERMREQIEDVLARARSGNVGKVRQLSPIDLKSFIEENLKIHSLHFSKKNITPLFESAGHNPTVLADQVALSELFENLVSNAIKFSPPGSQVRLSLTANGFIISDEGPGFSVADMAALFSRFSVLSAKPTAGESSTGLGLAICKQLILELKGELRCISAPGQPACFEVSLTTEPSDAGSERD